MAVRPVGNPYIKTSSPLGGTTRSPFENSYSTRNSYTRTSSPLFGRSYCSPFSSPFLGHRPWFRPYTSPVVVYDNPSPVVIHSGGREVVAQRNIVADCIVAAVGIAVAVAFVNAALTTQRICQMVQDCDDVISANGYVQTVCSEVYERCF